MAAGGFKSQIQWIPLSDPKILVRFISMNLNLNLCSFSYQWSCANCYECLPYVGCVVKHGFISQRESRSGSGSRSTPSSLLLFSPMPSEWEKCVILKSHFLLAIQSNQYQISNKFICYWQAREHSQPLAQCDNAWALSLSLSAALSTSLCTTLKAKNQSYVPITKYFPEA